MKRTKFSNSTKSYSMEELIIQLLEEWNKPKAQNIKKDYDKREARSYKVIKTLQKQIAELKRKS